MSNGTVNGLAWLLTVMYAIGVVILGGCVAVVWLAI